jgi:hypothetical protein
MAKSLQMLKKIVEHSNLFSRVHWRDLFIQWDLRLATTVRRTTASG